MRYKCLICFCFDQLLSKLASSSRISTERNEVVYGVDNVISEELLFFANSGGSIDTCMDSSRPSLATTIESIKKSFVDAKARGVDTDLHQTAPKSFKI